MDELLEAVKRGADPMVVFQQYLKEELDRKQKLGFTGRVKKTYQGVKKFAKDPNVRAFGRELGRGVALAVGTHQFAKHINKALDKK